MDIAAADFGLILDMVTVAIRFMTSSSRALFSRSPGSPAARSAAATVRRPRRHYHLLHGSQCYPSSPSPAPTAERSLSFAISASFVGLLMPSSPTSSSSSPQAAGSWRRHRCRRISHRSRALLTVGAGVVGSVVPLPPMPRDTDLRRRSAVGRGPGVGLLPPASSASTPCPNSSTRRRSRAADPVESPAMSTGEHVEDEMTCSTLRVEVCEIKGRSVCGMKIDELLQDPQQRSS